MESWYRERVGNKEVILLSESGFTSDTLTYRFLQHFIQHTHSGPDTPYKILLMDNYGSHLTPQFVLLARANNIVPFTFPAHLTHCMQPLDVGVFQSYKHWHNKAIQCAIETLDFDYTISSFLRDLSGIRRKPFKKTTIQHAFSSSGMWPINRQKVAEKMAKYMKEPASKEPTLPTLPVTPRTTKEFRTKWSELQPKIVDQLSSPTQRKFDSVQRGLHRILDDSDMTQIEKDMIYSRLSEVVRKKPTSRRRVQKGGELTTEQAQEQIAAKEALERSKWAKRLERAKRIKANKERRERHQAGVHARRIERLRKAELRKALEDDIGLAHVTIPIPDPETQDIQEDTQETILEGFEAGDPKNWIQEEVPDVQEDQVDHSRDWLQDDFVPFEEEDSSSDESFESFSSIIV
jgi:hypothetical protein